MARMKKTAEVPPCYAMVLPGLEAIAAEEIASDLGGDIRKTLRGIVVFRVPEITEQLLQLRTTEDVFVLAWGTDELTHRALDLKNITRWTASNADWQRLLQIHHAVHVRPKGKPTYHLVTQLTGQHVYHRSAAREALAKGLAGKFPASWKPAEENAAVEVWLTIQKQTAVCGLRLSDRTMRHRTYKTEHLPASLRPTVAAAMVRLAEAQAGMTVLDPMCGAGTLLAEQIESSRRQGKGIVRTWGGDRDLNALRAAVTNLRRVGPTILAQWDSRALPLATHSVDRILSNPPFGKQLSTPEEIGPLYRECASEWDRVLRPHGVAVLLVAEMEPLLEALRPHRWRPVRRLRVQILGQTATISVWRKPEE